MQQYVPQKIHFIFGLAPDFGGKPFSFMHWAAIKSARKLNPSYEVFYWTCFLPVDNHYFDDILEDVVIKNIIPPTKIFDKSIHHIAHQADVIRLQILKEHGGIYLDLDTITVKSFEPFLYNKFSICIQRHKESGQVEGLCNAIMFSEPQAKFVCRWLEEYRSFRSKGRDQYWDEHSVKVPLTLSKQFSDEDITVWPTEYFLYPDYTPAGLKKLFIENLKFEQAYAHHLWEQLSWGAVSRINENNLTHLSNSYTQMVLNILADEVEHLAQKRKHYILHKIHSKTAKLNLGSGSKGKLDFINCDMYPQSGADLIFDIVQGHWPIDSASSEYVELHHVLEHISGTGEVFFKELYRVMKHKAIVDIRVPHPRHDWFLIDPTHVKPWHPESFYFLDQEECLKWFFSGDAKSPLAIYWGINFKVKKIELIVPGHNMKEKITQGFNTTEFDSILPYLNNIIGETHVVLEAIKP